MRPRISLKKPETLHPKLGTTFSTLSQKSYKQVCCGAMIKYWCVAQGTVAGFIQYETPLKSWDHACGVLCVIESGGTSTDAFGEQVINHFSICRPLHVQKRGSRSMKR